MLANLFMHYAFDMWMSQEFPGCPFERYADDVIVHCDSEDQAWQLRSAIADRLGSLGLELHPVKTKIVCAPRAQEGEALRRRPSGGGVKPPHAALAEDCCGER